MDLTILSAEDIRNSLPMIEAIELMKQAFMQYSSGTAVVPLRTRIDVEKHRGISLMMPSLLVESDDLAVKIVSVFPENVHNELATIHAVVIVLDPQTGQPQAILEGSSLTAIRTGAASGAATDLLAREDAKTVAIFGTGVQARTQLEAVCCIRSIRQVWVFSLDPSGAEVFCNEMRTVQGVPATVEIAPSPEAAIGEADIICAATTSTTPVFPGTLVKPGTHVNAVGSFTPAMQEIDAVLLQKALITVDSREAVLAESGDLIIPIQEGMLEQNAIHAELGQIVAGDLPGRTASEQITVFKSVGLAVQDAIAASAALQNAGKRDVGIQVQL
jgi:ornithine cyclodeaminase/alanine dehydrogenase-like protein (mu-crystallin family)